MLFNELHDQLIIIDSRTSIGQSYPVWGKEILAQLGYGRRVLSECPATGRWLQRTVAVPYQSPMRSACATSRWPQRPRLAHFAQYAAPALA